MIRTRQLRMTVYASLFAALIAAGSYIAIPAGPVPIVLQNFFVMLAGLLLGRRWASMSVFIYLLAGSLGLPVFAGGAAGIGRVMGPTGGYLMGYLPAAFLIAVISEKGRGRVPADVLAMICGSAVVYAAGAGWLKLVAGLGWKEAAVAGVLPFLPGDALKIAAAVPVVKSLRPVVSGKFI